jgi:hypothetical protein
MRLRLSSGTPFPSEKANIRDYFVMLLSIANGLDQVRFAHLASPLNIELARAIVYFPFAAVFESLLWIAYALRGFIGRPPFLTTLFVDGAGGYFFRFLLA